MNVVTLHPEFVGLTLYHKIELVLKGIIDIESIDELYAEEYPYDYNITIPESKSLLDLRNFQMVILDASIKGKPYHLKTCKKCGKQYTLTFEDIEIKNYKYLCPECRKEMEKSKH